MLRAHNPPMGPRHRPKTQPIWWVGLGWAMGFVGYPEGGRQVVRLSGGILPVAPTVRLSGF
ncbi:hypothetical protein ACN42_g11352, partial [Penicillium freii]